MPYADYNDRLKRSREYRIEHHAQVLAYNRRYYRKNRKERIAFSVSWERKGREIISDSYVRELLCEYRTTLRPRDIPQSLVEAKREQLRLKREIRKCRSRTLMTCATS